MLGKIPSKSMSYEGFILLSLIEQMNYNDTGLDKPEKYKHWCNFSWYYANSAISFLKHDNLVGIVFFLKD